jgi:hypothetical protein
MSARGPRESRTPAMAATDPRFRGRDLQVLCLLGCHGDRRGWCCRSQVKMAEQLRCGRATVQRSIARLVEYGYLEVRPKQRSSGADAACDYRLIFEPPHENRDNPGDLVATGHAKSSARVANGCSLIDELGVPTPERAPKLTSPINESEKCAREVEFDSAYRAWPTSCADSRALGWAVWTALTDDEKGLAASEAARCVLAMKASGRTLICSFATYLNEKRWLNLPPRLAVPDHRVRANTAPPKPSKFLHRLAAGEVDLDAARREKAAILSRCAERIPR